MPAASPDRRATQLPPPADLPPVTGGSTSGGPEIPLEERIVLAAVYCFGTWFSGKPVRARGLMNDVPEFRDAYTSPNAIGTLLGRGVARHGLGLFRRGDAYPPTYANGWQLLQKLSPELAARVAERLGLASVDALANAVRGLADSAM
jgi:hypothetical protein